MPAHNPSAGAKPPLYSRGGFMFLDTKLNLRPPKLVGAPDARSSEWGNSSPSMNLFHSRRHRSLRIRDALTSAAADFDRSMPSDQGIVEFLIGADEESAPHRDEWLRCAPALREAAWIRCVARSVTDPHRDVVRFRSLPLLRRATGQSIFHSLRARPWHTSTA